jgi:hypothetical protein
VGAASTGNFAGKGRGDGVGAAASAPSLVGRSSVMIARGVPMATVSPSRTRIWRSTPAWADGTSVSTLSVDTS